MNIFICVWVFYFYVFPRPFWQFFFGPETKTGAYLWDLKGTKKIQEYVNLAELKLAYF